MDAIATRIDPTSPEFAANAKSMRARVDALRRCIEEVLDGGGVLASQKHISRGKLLVRDRIRQLVDPSSPFLEVGLLAAHDMYGGEVPGAGIVAGVGRVEGLDCMIVANDATAKGGTYYPLTVKKHLRAQEIAEHNNLPCIYLMDSGGVCLAKQDEVFPDRDHFGRIVFNQATLSARGIPQIAVVMGACVAEWAALPAMGDQTVMVKNVMPATEPEQLSEVADYVAENDSHALHVTRRIVATLNRERRTAIETTDAPLYDPHELYGLIPSDPRRAYDVREVIARIVDGSLFDEFKAGHGETLVTGFARLYGMSVGIIANNGPMRSDAALKAAHFVQICVQRSVPLLFLQNAVDSPVECASMARDVAKLLTAVATASIPKLTLVIGGSFGAGNYAMCGRACSPRFLWTWPNARISMMEAERAATTLATQKRAAMKAKHGKWTDSDETAFKEPIRSQFETRGQPLFATARLWDDGIIDPAMTRHVIGLSLAVVVNASRQQSK